MLKPLLLALLAAATLATQAQERPAQAVPDAQAIAAERVARNYHQRVAAQIAGSGQSRDLALAAVLRELAVADPREPSQDDGQASAWRSAAAGKAGTDVLANAMLMMGAADRDAALREQAAQRWARAEPDNIAPLLFQHNGVEALLAGARRYTRFDLHMYDQVRWIQSTLTRHPPTANEQALLFGAEAAPVEEHAASSAMAIWAAAAIPSLQELLQACEGPALRATSTRRGDCEYLARVLVGASDSSLGRMLGIDMLARTAGNASERAEAQVLRRRMDWQMFEWGRIAAQQPREGAPQFARLLADPSVRTEHDLVERILTEAGVPLDPPAGWRPPR